MIKDVIIFVLILVVFLLVAYIIRLRRINKEVKENCEEFVKHMFNNISKHMFKTIDELVDGFLDYVSPENYHNALATLINICKVNGIVVDIKEFDEKYFKEREK